MESSANLRLEPSASNTSIAPSPLPTRSGPRVGAAWRAGRPTFTREVCPAPPPGLAPPQTSDLKLAPLTRPLAEPRPDLPPLSRAAWARVGAALHALEPQLWGECADTAASPPQAPLKCSWPELVGARAASAVATIAKERLTLMQVITLPEDATVTADFREERVRVFTDTAGRVAKMPVCG